MVHVLTPIVLAGLLSGPAAHEVVGTGPQPSPTTISWELEFDFLDPQRIEVQLPGTTQPEVYWYIVYTVTNPGQRTQRFFPMFEIVTEDLRVLETDMGIDPLVFNAIAERHRITHKYMVSPTKAIGPLRAGADNARESVAIWRGVELNQNNFRVYVAGLSGESRFVANPAYDPDQPEEATGTGSDGRSPAAAENPQYFTLRKTLEIPYTLPGSPAARTTAEPERGDARWIMR